MNESIKKVICPYCDHPAELVTGVTAYPLRPDLYEKAFWNCNPCQARVGCHPGTTKPLGRLADSKLRYWKIEAHAAFDPIWRSGEKKRNQAYRWLAREMGISSDDCHIGMMDIADCKKVVSICRNKRGW